MEWAQPEHCTAPNCYTTLISGCSDKFHDLGYTKLNDRCKKLFKVFPQRIYYALQRFAILVKPVQKYIEYTFINFDSILYH